MGDLERIKDKLQASGFKLTPQRRSVVSVILNSSGKILSAEEIFVQVRQVSPEIGLATVYRTLDILSNLSVLEKLFLTDDGVARYNINYQQNGLFIEFICLSCGKRIELAKELLSDLDAVIKKDSAFAVKSVRTHIEGLCEACQKQGKNVIDY
ncbi:MAG: transcriptional repressor [Streptococcaceae bacterium]|jgi:Fur family ferric uptake transcriptional regulator|nr:transcriptional repressor [Streptococcaceae bacterium]